MIKTLENVFRGLNADNHGRHSVDLQPETRSILDPPFPKAAHSNSNDGLQNKNHKEE